MMNHVCSQDNMNTSFFFILILLSRGTTFGFSFMVKVASIKALHGLHCGFIVIAKRI